MIATTQLGPEASSSIKKRSKATRGTSPLPDARALRRLLASTLSAPRSPASNGTEPDEPAEWESIAIPQDRPPGLEARGPSPAPAYVYVGAKLIAGLRRDYGRGVASDDGRRIGDIPEVASWLEGLKPGKFAPEERA